MWDFFIFTLKALSLTLYVTIGVVVFAPREPVQFR